MPTTNEIVDFVKDFTRLDNIIDETDIFDRGVGGDDFDELIEKYAKTYSVDMKTYLWYFHSDEEGSGGIGRFFFSPPNKRVKRIPVTPSLLTEFANKGKWGIKYPKHKIPKRRYDLIINGILSVIIIVCLIVCIFLKCQ